MKNYYLKLQNACNWQCQWSIVSAYRLSSYEHFWTHVTYDMPANGCTAPMSIHHYNLCTCVLVIIWCVCVHIFPFVRCFCVFRYIHIHANSANFICILIHLKLLIQISNQKPKKKCITVFAVPALFVVSCGWKKIYIYNILNKAAAMLPFSTKQTKYAAILFALCSAFLLLVYISLLFSESKQTAKWYNRAHTINF